MKKLRLTKKGLVVLDWSLWLLSMGFSFWADWRIGVAFLAYDIMRGFEKVKDDGELEGRLVQERNRIINAVAEYITDFLSPKNKLPTK